MKVAVTGAAGFLGSHVADVLENDGFEVVRLDKDADAARRIVAADLLSPDALKAALGGVEGVCHFAAVGDVYLAFENPPLAATINATGTANMLEAAKAVGVKKFVYISTWEVYGEPEYQPMDEKHPCRPDHPYNITKLAGEHLAMAYDRLKGVPAVALRIGTAFGTRMRSNSVFSIFIRKGMKGEPITIKGTGEQGREFVHAFDIGRACALVLRSDLRGEVFNITGTEFVSIKRLAELVSAKFPTEIKYEEARAGDIAPAKVSTEKARKLLGWQPEVAFEQGLAGIIEEAIAKA